jgi:hypothetical protein
MRTKQRSSQCRVPRASLLITLTTIILFSCSQQSLAQQKDGDATNADSNTSNTAPNRSAVNFTFNFANLTLLNGEFLEAFGANNSRGILRGHPTIPGTELGSTTADPLIFSTNSTERMRILANGSVGIGTTSPGNYKLNVNGSLFGAAMFTSYVADGLYGATAVPSRIRTPNVNGGILFGYEDLGSGDYSPRIGLQQTHDVAFAPNITTTKASIGLVRNGNITIKGGASNGEFVRIDNSGNVGIGTDSPAKKLHIFSSNSQVMIDRPANTAGNYALINFATNHVEKFNIGMNADSNPGVDKLSFLEGAFSVTVPVMTITGGNLGIGTTAPAHKLDVVGEVRASGGFRFADGTVQNTSGQWTTSGANIHYTAGNVGINVTNPLAKLHVVGVAPLGTAAFMGTTWVSHFNYNGDQSEDTYIRGGKANSRVLINDGHTGNILMALNGGNVGIGTVTPTAKLHVQGDGRVTGNLTVDGNIAAKYQDMAEWVPAAEQLSAGIVVVVDTSKPNHVISSSTSYDARVAGVISAQPGIVLGEKSDNKVLVATTGRVRVKVDATNGPIQIGDLLVTSNREGFAMKSLPVDLGGVRMHRPGTLIGKALEPLTSGTGEILVLLSLQ